MSNQLQENYTTDLPDSKNNPPIDLVQELLNQSIAPLEEKPPIDEVVPKFFPLSLRTLRDLPKKKFIVNGLLGETDIAMIYGSPGSGKTFVVIDLIIAMTTGIDFMDRYAIGKPLNVVYATNEGLSGLAQRFKASENKYIARVDNDKELITNATDSRLFIFDDMPQLYMATDKTIGKLITDINHYGIKCDVLILDTLSNASLGANENDNSQMAVAMDVFKAACKQLGCCGVFVHHAGKGGGYRGASVLHAVSDLALEVNKDERQDRELKIYKIKDRVNISPSEGETFPFYLNGDIETESCYPIWDTDSERTSKQNDKKSIDDLRGSLEGEMTQTEAVNVMTGKGFTHREAVSTLNRFVSEGRLPKPERGGKTGRAQVYDFSGFFLDNNNTSLQSSK